MDGNFTAEHQKMRNPANDVRLTDGMGFMVSESDYQKHLQSSVETKQA